LPDANFTIWWNVATSPLGGGTGTINGRSTGLAVVRYP
jgi:hypothetical protein